MLDPCVAACVVEFIVLVVRKLDILVDFCIVLGHVFEVEQEIDVYAFLGTFVSGRESTDKAFEILRGQLNAVFLEEGVKVILKDEF